MRNWALRTGDFGMKHACIVRPYECCRQTESRGREGTGGRTVTCTFWVYLKASLAHMPTCCKHLVKQSPESLCRAWAKPRTSLVSHRPSQSVISWIKWQLPKWLEQDRWMGRGIKRRSGGREGGQATEQRPLSQHVTHPHPNQNHCPWRDSQHEDN